VGHARLGGAVSALGRGRVDCIRDIFILNEMWVQGKAHILIGTLVKIFYLSLSIGSEVLAAHFVIG
jgi:hypothetical protein